MYTKRRYGFWVTFNWSKKPFILGVLYATLITICYCYFKKNYAFDISINWQPLSVLGIAVAFYLGFKNNASYDRTWEARKIWGGIVNNSRTLGIAICSFIEGEKADEIKKELIYRHIAWLTALRYQLRLQREWEHIEYRVKGKYVPQITEQFFDHLEDDLKNYVCEKEFQTYKDKSNIAVHILQKQSLRIQELYNTGYFNDYKHLEFHRILSELINEQGRSERIKNFPFPRQYASVAVWMSLIFALVIPFGLLNVFGSTSNYSVLLAIPFSGLIIWIFFLMEMIGDFSENPFEGTYNDTPITSISRGIEIDLRQMIEDKDIPKPITADEGFLM